MKIVKVTSKEELEKLEKIVNEKLELVKTVRDSFGWDCFTEEPEQKIKVLRKLNLYGCRHVQTGFCSTTEGDHTQDG